MRAPDAAQGKAVDEVSDLMVRSASSRVSNHEAGAEAANDRASRKTI
jgi:hypothetical protein